MHAVPSGDARALEAAVARQPIAIGSDMESNKALQHYSGGVFTGACSTSPNHVVLLVGYGTSGRQRFWKIKNSWGPKWGEGGYARLERDRRDGPGKCGIQIYAVFPIKVSPNPSPTPIPGAISPGRCRLQLSLPSCLCLLARGCVDCMARMRARAPTAGGDGGDERCAVQAPSTLTSPRRSATGIQRVPGGAAAAARCPCTAAASGTSAAWTRRSAATAAGIGASFDVEAARLTEWQMAPETSASQPSRSSPTPIPARTSQMRMAWTLTPSSSCDDYQSFQLKARGCGKRTAQLYRPAA